MNIVAKFLIEVFPSAQQHKYSPKDFPTKLAIFLTIFSENSNSLIKYCPTKLSENASPNFPVPGIHNPVKVFPKSSNM